MQNVKKLFKDNLVGCLAFTRSMLLFSGFLFLSCFLQITEGTCNTYGNIMELNPSGASVSTSRQIRGNDGSLVGVAASRHLVDEDINRLNNLKDRFEEVGNRHCIHPAVLAAVTSRESRAGNALDNGMGDHGAAFGIMQCDLEHSGLDCKENEIGFNSLEHIEMMTSQKLLRDFATIKNKVPFSSMSKERQLQAAVAAYNFGTSNARSWERLDIGSTGDDYSNDVMARAQWLIDNHQWQCDCDNSHSTNSASTCESTRQLPSCASIAKVSRSEWGAQNPRSSSPLPHKPVKDIYIHHTLGDRCTTKDFCSQKARDHQRYHMVNNNWSDIGYNYLVGEDGRAYVGRGWDKIGGHTLGFNTQGVAISVIGNFMEDVPNADALKAIKALIRCAIEAGVLDCNYDLYGHRDKRSTDCPGDALYDEIKTWPHYKGAEQRSNRECNPIGNPVDPMMNVQSCTKLGDVEAIRTNGAKQATANQDGLRVTGVPASNKLVDNDYDELMNYKECFYNTGRKYGIHPALIAAIASRESRAGRQMSGSNKYGMMQCDQGEMEIYGIECMKYGRLSCNHVEMMVRDKLVKDTETVQRIHPSWSLEDQLKGAVAAYDFGTCMVQTIGNLDGGSNNDDYSDDVVARAQRLIERNWKCEGITEDSNAPATGDVVNPCRTMVETGNCEFYQQCVEAEMECGQNGYALNYAYKYCNRFAEFYEDFNDAGKNWIDEVRVCLMDVVYNALKNPNIRTCNKLKEVAFDSHVKCYIESGDGICSVFWNLDNALGLWNVYDIQEDFFGEDWISAWEQVFVTAIRCIGRYIVGAPRGLIYLRDKTNEKLTSVGRIISGSFDSCFGETEEDCVQYASEGDCRFYECFEKKFPCEKEGAYSHIKHFELTSCMEFLKLKESNTQVKQWMKSTQICMMNHLLPYYQQSSINCNEIKLLMESKRIDCMVDSGFGSLGEPAKWTIARATNSREFPMQMPDQFTTLPLSRGTFKNDVYYYRELHEFQRQIGVTNHICATNRGEEENRRELYRMEYSTKYDMMLKIRNVA